MYTIYTVACYMLLNPKRWWLLSITWCNHVIIVTSYKARVRDDYYGPCNISTTAFYTYNYRMTTTGYAAWVSLCDHFYCLHDWTKWWQQRFTHCKCVMTTAVYAVWSILLFTRCNYVMTTTVCTMNMCVHCYSLHSVSRCVHYYSLHIVNVSSLLRFTVSLQ